MQYVHRPKHIIGLCAVLLVHLPSAGAVSESPSALDRLQLDYLKKAQADRLRFASERQSGLPLPGGLHDYRVVLHAHSSISHDSRGTVDEIAEAARQVGVNAVFLSEHPPRDRDPIAQGLQGMHAGVLFVPGTEENNLLVYPKERRHLDSSGMDRPTFIRSIMSAGGLVFIAHTDTWSTWDQVDVVGMEIYNTHVDVKDEKELMALLSGRQGLQPILSLAEAFRNYPRVAFACLFDPTEEALRRFDELNQKGHIVGIAGNDSHANTGFVITKTADGGARVQDALGDDIVRLSPEQTRAVFPNSSEAKEGDTLFSLKVDPYEASFGYVSTHVLAPRLEEEALRESLRAGHCYVAFDWMADPTGFLFTAQTPGGLRMMGDRVAPGSGVVLKVQSPLSAEMHLFRNGRLVASHGGRSWEVPVQDSGVYRAELDLTVAGEHRPWIYSNPIFVRADSD